jgi:hypothetical protein
LLLLQQPVVLLAPAPLTRPIPLARLYTCTIQPANTQTTETHAAAAKQLASLSCCSGLARACLGFHDTLTPSLSSEHCYYRHRVDGTTLPCNLRVLSCSNGCCCAEAADTSPTHHSWQAHVPCSSSSSSRLRAPYYMPLTPACCSSSSAAAGWHGGTIT